MGGSGVFMCTAEMLFGGITSRLTYACAAVFVNESVPLSLTPLGICRLIYLYLVLEEISFRKSHLKFPSIDRKGVHMACPHRSDWVASETRQSCHTGWM